MAVTASITNQSPGELHYLNRHDWVGGGKYPMTIAKGDTGRFIHLEKGPLSGGSVAAVVYSGINRGGQKKDNCAWLLAWKVNDSTTSEPYPLNKVGASPVPF